MTAHDPDDSGLYAKAKADFDQTLDEVAAAVGSVSSERVRDILDRYKAATHALLRAQRFQVIDDCQATIYRLETRVRNLEGLLGVARALGEPDDPTGSDAGAHPRG